jgi:hypothetical protein
MKEIFKGSLQHKSTTANSVTLSSWGKTATRPRSMLAFSFPPQLNWNRHLAISFPRQLKADIQLFWFQAQPNNTGAQTPPWVAPVSLRFTDGPWGSVGTWWSAVHGVHRNRTLQDTISSGHWSVFPTDRPCLTVKGAVVIDKVYCVQLLL